MIDSQALKEAFSRLVQEDDWAAEEALEEEILRKMQDELEMPRHNAANVEYSVGFYQGQIRAIRHLQTERMKYLKFSQTHVKQ